MAQPQQQIQQQQPGQAPAAPQIQTGRLRDPAPDPFNGDRSKSELFKRQFRLYRGLNANHEVMGSPYLRTMLALTLIKGPLVDDWAADQVEELETKVNRPNNPIDTTDETLWTDFVTAFDSNFSDVTKKEQALTALYHLRMQKDRFDDYIATFKHYAKQAQFDLTHPATIRLFAMGIEKGLQDAILHRDTQPTTIQEYIDAGHMEIQKYQNRQSIKYPGHAKYQWIGAAQQYSLPRRHVKQGHMRHAPMIHPNDQVVPMDIDQPIFTQIRRAYTEAQKQDHKARGACFRCSKQGHMARDCPTRKEQPFKPSFQSNQPRFPSNKPPFKKPFGQKPLGQKPFGQKRPPSQGFRKFNKPFAYQYVQQARTAAIEEGEEEGEEYEPDEISDLAARTSRLSEDEREALIQEMANADPNF